MLKQEMERTGTWLFRWRSFLPFLAGILVVHQFLTYDYPLGSERLDFFLEVACFAVATLGLAFRCLAGGWARPGTARRSTDRTKAAVLVTDGMFSLCRNPLYFGNFLICIGIVLFFHSILLTLVFILLFWLYYERIVLAEERFLQEKFGAEFDLWADRTPVFLPAPWLWKKPAAPFSWRRVLRREYPTVFWITTTLTAFEVAGDWRVKGSPGIEPVWTAILAAGLFVPAIILFLKKCTRVLKTPAEPGAPGTDDPPKTPVPEIPPPVSVGHQTPADRDLEPPHDHGGSGVARAGADRGLKSMLPLIRGKLPPGIRSVGVLKDDWFAHTRLIESDGKLLVLKLSRFGPGRFPLFHPFEDFMARRERDAYRALRDVPGVPALHTLWGRNFFLHEYISGEPLSHRKEMGLPFLDDLEALVRAVHDRGVSLLDISKRENILVQDDGKPALLDFQISFLEGEGFLTRLLFEYFKSIDLFHLHKRRLFQLKRMGGVSVATESMKPLPFTIRWHRRFLRRPWLAVKRRFSEKGAGERTGSNPSAIPVVDDEK